MRALVDTHAYFWWATDDAKLSELAREIIADGDNEIFISAVLTWELATKARFGKWPEGKRVADAVTDTMAENAFQPLPISLEHARVAGFLPMRHRDPFDRVLAAQSEIQGMPLITADPIFQSFGTQVMW
jgi:PIN domain nuclease of toxin-antitoxin system